LGALGYAQVLRFDEVGRAAGDDVLAGLRPPRTSAYSGLRRPMVTAAAALLPSPLDEDRGAVLSLSHGRPVRAQPAGWRERQADIEAFAAL